MPRLVGFRTRGKGSNRQVYPIKTGQTRHSSSFPPRNRARDRSRHALQVDKGLRARVPEEKETWEHVPNRWDWPGVDLPQDIEAKQPVETRKGSLEGQATYNRATGWMSLEFKDKPSEEVRAEMKREGFRYRPRSKQWAAKWSDYREQLAQRYFGTVETVNISPDYALKAQNAEAQAEKHYKESDERMDRFHKELDTIPFGQPILVGHYSEKGHRAHLARLDKQMEKAQEEREIAEKYEERAKRYEVKAKGEPPGLIKRRIEKLEAEERRYKRELEDIERIKKLDPERQAKYYPHLEENEKHFNAWLEKTEDRLQVEREHYKASGGIAMDRIRVKPGDVVKTSYGTARVLKVNPKTVTIHILGQREDWNLKVEHSRILGKEES